MPIGTLALTDVLWMTAPFVTLDKVFTKGRVLTIKRHDDITCPLSLGFDIIMDHPDFVDIPNMVYTPVLDRHDATDQRSTFVVSLYCRTPDGEIYTVIIEGKDRA